MSEYKNIAVFTFKNIEPFKLIDTAKKVSVKHKSVRALARDESEYEDIIKTINDTDIKDINKIAFKISKFHFYYILKGVINQTGEYSKKVFHILNIRESIFSIEIIFDLLINFPDNELLFSFMTFERCSKHKKTDNCSLLSAVIDIFNNKKYNSFIGMITAVYIDAGISIKKFSEKFDIAFDSALITMLLKTLLKEFQKIVLDIEGSDALFSYVINNLTISELKSFGSCYFQVIKKNDLDPRIIKHFLNMFGNPNNDNNWNFITDDDALSELKNIYSLMEVEKFFKENIRDNDRFEFWSVNFNKKIYNAYKFPHVEAIMMYIGEIAIIEFADPGNACYIYNSESGDVFKNKGYSIKKASLLKHKKIALCRILHNQDWRLEALNKINNLIFGNSR